MSGAGSGRHLAPVVNPLIALSLLHDRAPQIAPAFIYRLGHLGRAAGIECGRCGEGFVLGAVVSQEVEGVRQVVICS